MPDQKALVLKEHRRAYYKAHKKDILSRQKAYHQENRTRILDGMKQRYLSNREVRLARQKKYYLEHRRKILAYVRAWNLKNKDHVRARAKERRLENIEEIQAKERERSKRRYQDPRGRAKIKVWRQRNLPRLREKLALRFFSLKEKLGGHCAICGDCRLDILEFDHKKPLCQNGCFRDRGDVFKHPEKFSLLCPNCHAIKSSHEKQSESWNNAIWKYWSRRFQVLAMFGSRCGKCGYDENILALEFDHKNGLDGRKRQPAVCDVPKYPWEFQLLCANCHTIKTTDDFRKKTGQAACG